MELLNTTTYERISQFLPFDMNYETSFPLEEICYIIWLQMLALFSAEREAVLT